MHLSDITSFGKNYDPLSMNISLEAEKFEPEPTFEKTINEIKDNHLKIIAYATINISDTTLFDENIEQPIMNIRIEVETFEPETTCEKTIHDIKANNLKSITSIDMNVSDMTSNIPASSSEYLKSDLMLCILPKITGKITISL